MLARNRLVFALLIAAAGLACDLFTSPPTTGSIAVRIVNPVEGAPDATDSGGRQGPVEITGSEPAAEPPASADLAEVLASPSGAVALDAVRVTATGNGASHPNTQSTPSGGVFRNTIPGLTPGNYGVTVEGLVSNEVEFFGNTSNVAVVAGQTTTATVSNFLSFVPQLDPTPLPASTSMRPSLTIPAVANATGYQVQWDRTTGFSNPQQTSVASNVVSITLADTGTFFVRARASNQTVSQGRFSVSRAVRVIREVGDTSDSPIAAPALGFGALVDTTLRNRNIAPAGDLDWYAVLACAGDTLFAEARAVRLTSPSPLDAVLQVVGPADQVIDSNDNADSTDARTKTTIPEDGAYRIRVSGVGSGTGHYELMARVARGPTNTGTACPATRVAFTTQPSTVASTVPLGPVSVGLRDAVGNPVSEGTQAVTIGLGANPGAGSLSGTTTVALTNGTATFTDLSLDKVGSGYTLVASSPDLASGTSSQFGILVGPVSPARSTVSASADTVASGSTATITLQAKDAGGNNLVSGGLTVVFAPSGGTSTGTITGAVDNGDGTYTATFTAVIAGTATSFGATIDGVPITSAVAGVTVIPGPVATVSPTPTGTTISVGGATQSYAAEARDAAGNLITGKTFAWASLNPAIATLDPSSGVATGVTAGQVTVSATADGVVGYAVLTVVVPGATPVGAWSGMISGTTQFLGALWGTSSSDIHAGGAAGTLRRFDGTTWNAMTSGTTESVEDIWGTATSDVYAVGAGGTILHFDGSAWSTVASGTTANLAGVWSAGPTDVFVVGQGGTIRRFNGSSWSAMTSNTTQDLASVWATAPSNVFAVGAGGTILRFDGSNWSAMTSPTSQALNAVWGTGPDNVFAVGAGGTILRFDGTDWSAMTSPTSVTLNDVWANSATDAYAAGDAGTLLRLNATGWTVMATGTTANLGAVWGTSTSTSVFAVGDGGAIRRGVRGAVSVAVSPSSGDIAGVGTTRPFTAQARDIDGNVIAGKTFTWASLNPNVATVNSSTGVATAVGAGQVTLSASVDGVTGFGLATVAAAGAAPVNLWTSMNDGVVQTLFGVWGTSATDVFVVGGSGTILRFNGSSWSPMSSGVTVTLNAVWGSSANDVYAVGTSGTILHFDGTSWAAMTSGTTLSLAGVWGTSPKDVFAIGSTGTILHFDGVAWTAMTSGSSSNLLEVWGTSSSDVYAVGVTGVILHFDGTTWTAMTSGTGQSLTSVRGTSATDVYAVGPAGTILRFNGTSWAPMTSGTTAALQAVWAASNGEAYAVGSGGTILHFNGTDWSSLTSGSTLTLFAVWGSPGSHVFVTSSQSSDLVLRGFRGASVLVTPGTLTMATISAAQQLTAEIKDVGGNPVPGLTVGWGTTNSLTANVNGSGLVAAHGNGTVTITASASGLSGTATVTVAPVGSVVVTPAGASIAGGTQAFVAEGRAAGGNLIAGLPAFTWASLNDAVAIVNSSSGVATAVASGQVPVSATIAGVTGHGLLTVAIPGATPVSAWTSMLGVGAGTDVWGFSATNIFGVGSSVSRRYDGTNWNPIASPGSVLGVWGISGSDLFAVGFSGLISHFDGSVWSTMNSGTSTSVTAVWGASPRDVFAVTGLGGVLHFDGISWAQMAGGTTQSLNGVWGTSARDVYAVGNSGTILHFDGAAWTTMTSGTTVLLNDIWGTSASDIYAVGTGGTIRHFDGTSWGGMTSGTTQSLQGVWGTSTTDVYAVGLNGTVLRFDGTSWTVMSAGGTLQLGDVWGTSGSDVFAVATASTLLRGMRGAASVTVTPGSTPMVLGVTAPVQLGAELRDAGGSLLAGAIFTWTSSKPAVATVDQFNGIVTAVGNGTATIAANTGGIAGAATVTVTGGSVVTITPAGASLNGGSGTLTAEARDAGGNVIPGASFTWASLNPNVATVTSSGTVTAVASGQTTVSATSNGVTGSALLTVSIPAAAAVTSWSAMASQTTSQLEGIWGVSENDIWAVGLGGTIRHFDGSAWSTIPGGGGGNLEAVWGSSTSDVFAVGLQIRHWDGTSWNSMTSPTSQLLNSVWGSSPKDVYAVGAAGTIINFNGSSWTAVASGTGQALNAVWGTSANDVFAVGAAGTILHYDGATWAPMTSGTTSLLTWVWGTSASNVYAVGSPGIILRFNGSTWTAMTSGSTLQLNSIWGTSEGELYAVAGGGGILRFDGTTWSAMSSGTTTFLTTVWGTAQSAVYAAGTGGVMLRGTRGGAASVVVTPGTVPMVVGVTAPQQLSAELRDAGGSTLSQATFTWVSGKPAVATVDANGLVTAVGNGTATITATSGAVSGTATVTVSGGTVVAVTPGGASLAGGNTTLVAEARDMGGNVIPGAVFTWASLNPNVATVNGSGTVTAVASGQATISATSSGVTGHALVTVAIPGATPVQSWSAMISGTTTVQFAGIWGFSPSDIYAVGTGGTAGAIRHFDGASWNLMDIGSTQTLGAVWGSSATDVYIVGAAGTIRHFDGANWSGMTSGTTETLSGVWGSSPTDIYAVGSNGTILYFNGVSWSRVTSGTTFNLTGVWGSSAADVYVAAGSGQSGAILHYDGAAWSPVPPFSVLPVISAWGTGANDVFAVGVVGTIYRNTGGGFGSLPSGTTAQLDAIWGTSPGDVYVTGTVGTIRRFDGSTWAAMSSGTTGQLIDVWGTSAGPVYAVGGGGTIQRGTRGQATVVVTPGSVNMDTRLPRQLTAELQVAGIPLSDASFTWTTSNTAVATVSASGLVTGVTQGTATITVTSGAVSGTAAVTVTLPTLASVVVTPAGATLSGGSQAFAAQARDAGGTVIPEATVTWASLNPNVVTINSSSGVATVVSSGQATISATTEGVTGYALVTVATPGATPVNLWAPMTSGTTQTLLDVWGTANDDVYAVGTAGTILRFNGTSWTAMTSGTAAQLQGVWGTSAGDVYAVGSSGTILRFNGTSWSPMTSPTGSIFQSVWGSSPSDIYAAINSTTLARFDGATWRLFSTGASSTRALWGTSANDIFAVGPVGVITRYTGNGWTPMTSGTGATLFHIWGSSSADVYAVGANAPILRFNGSAWADHLAGSNTLNAIWGTSSTDIYAVGNLAFRYNGSAWTQVTGWPILANGVWGTQTGNVYAVGFGGAILRGVRGGTVTVTPETPIVALDVNLQLTATARDAQSNVVDGGTFTWTSDNETVVTVNSSGVIHSVGPGTATITATALGGAAGSTEVTVAAPPFNGSLSSASGNSRDIITATAAGGGPPYDADMTATLDGVPLLTSGTPTATTFKFAVPPVTFTGAKTLIFRSIGPDQLDQQTTFTVNGTSLSDPSEPNNTGATALPISTNGDYFVTLHGTCFEGNGTGSDDCQDLFAITNSTGSPISVTARFDWNGASDVDILWCTLACDGSDFTGNFDGATGANPETSTVTIGAGATIRLMANLFDPHGETFAFVRVRITGLP